MDRVATSATDTSFTAGAVTGSDLGCTEAVVFVVGASEVTSLVVAALSAGRFFGFFGVVAAVDMSEPDFLSLTVAAVDFLTASLPFASDPTASSSREADPVALGADDDAGDPVSEPDEADEDDCFDAPEDPDDGDEDELEEDDLEESVSEGPAQATPGVVATATPTPNATAKPPTRPTYLA